MVARHELQPIAYDQPVSWPFADFIFASGFDNISSTIKARQSGFHACIDTEHMFRHQFEQLRRLKAIPEIV